MHNTLLNEKRGGLAWKGANWNWDPERKKRRKFDTTKSSLSLGGFRLMLTKAIRVVDTNVRELSCCTERSMLEACLLPYLDALYVSTRTQMGTW